MLARGKPAATAWFQRARQSRKEDEPGRKHMADSKYYPGQMNKYK